MKALITGITGFAGSHLAELLLKEGLEVYGIARWRSPLDNLCSDVRNRCTIPSGDIKDSTSLHRTLERVRPDYIFHLAAQSYVPDSWAAPLETLTTNILGTANLLEAVRQTGIDCRVQIAGSSEEYGLVHKHELPITEKNPLRPQSPYGVSKVACDLLAQQYYKSFSVKTIITRAFNHTGPRRGEVFVTSTFAKQIALIEVGKQEPVIKVGNLEAYRDFTDVRDVAEAYYLAVKECELGEPYNICSGHSYQISEVLDILLSLSKVEVQVKPDPSRMRPSDVPYLQGNCDKFKKATGWEPAIPFEKTMEDLLNYWRERVL